MNVFRIIHQTRRHWFAGIVSLVLAPCVFADGGNVPLVKITPQTDLSDFNCSKSTLSSATVDGTSVLGWKLSANQTYPRLQLKPKSGAWNLSAAKGIRALITNPGDAPLSIALQVENEHKPGQEPYSKGTYTIGAGETRLVQTVFGQLFGKPAFPLDPTKITGLALYVAGGAVPIERTLFVRSIETFVTEQTQPPPDMGPPSTAGLVLWLDASKESTATVDANRRVSKLADRSAGHHDATAPSPERMPQLTPSSPKERTAIRFTGKEALTISPIRTAPNGVTAFVVYTGVQTLGSDPALLSSRPNSATGPDAAPNFQIAAPGPKDPWRFTRTVAVENVPIGPITIGQGYVGNINEVLIFDHTFPNETDRQKVLEYLKNKWNANASDIGWLRTAPLDPKPERAHNDLPLSDQTNKDKWTLDPKFSDDFPGTAIDLNRYALSSSFPWPGTKPALFTPDNVSVADGTLKIKFQKGIPEHMKAPAEYIYSTGYVRTKERTSYGYYEIEAKAAFAACDSAFWFADTGDSDNQTELDIFEMAAHSPKFPNNDYMTAHVWNDNGDKHHWASNTFYHPSWNIADDYHVYGFEWTKEKLKWYVDGSLIREIKNTNWHRPMYLTFDAECQIAWMGAIDEKDLPAEYDIKHLRVWRQTTTSTP